MFSTQPFDAYPQEYDAWFDQHPHVFGSELDAVRKVLPELANRRVLEIGMGTGRFSKALGIKEGIEPSRELRKIAAQRGIVATDAIAEKLPYEAGTFDVVLMISCISYFTDPAHAIQEAKRVLKKDGLLIIGFIDKNSDTGKAYEAKRLKSHFYRYSSFYTPHELKQLLSDNGFDRFHFVQTLFGTPEEIHSIQPAEEGYGKGSFAVLSAAKSNTITGKNLPL